MGTVYRCRECNEFTNVTQHIIEHRSLCITGLKLAALARHAAIHSTISARNIAGPEFVLEEDWFSTTAEP